MLLITFLILILILHKFCFCVGDKAGLRNMIIKEADATVNQYIPNAKWIFDGMAIVRSVKPSTTYEEFFKCMLLPFTPPKDSSPKLIEIIMDNYLANSIKESTRQKRGDGQRVFITGLGQTMPQGVNWQSLLSNNENKTDLIHCFVEYLKQPAVRSIFKVPIIITEKDRTWKIDSTGIQELQSCNHEEADTRLALHATHHNHNCVITSKDTDVFLLLVYAYHKSSSNKIWYMKHEPNKFINIGKVCAYLGGTISEHLLKFHAMTGCDTTSYFYRVGKIRVMKP